MYVPCIQILISLPPPLPTSAPSSATSVHSGSSMHSSRRSQRKFSLATDDIKVCVYNGTGVYPSVSLCIYLSIYPIQLSLLDHTEKLLVTLCHQLESSSRREVMELRVWAHLQLAQAYLTLHHGRSAAEFGSHEAATEGGRSRKEVLMFLGSGNGLWVCSSYCSLSLPQSLL